MGQAKKRGTYEERITQSKKGIKSYEQFLEAKEKGELPKVEKEKI
jgi:hypothetical protein